VDERGLMDVMEMAWVFRQAAKQGLTLVHFSAQLERFLWDRGCA
jgi:hypothetical protein